MKGFFHLVGLGDERIADSDRLGLIQRNILTALDSQRFQYAENDGK